MFLATTSSGHVAAAGPCRRTSSISISRRAMPAASRRAIKSDPAFLAMRERVKALVFANRSRGRPRHEPSLLPRHVPVSRMPVMRDGRAGISAMLTKSRFADLLRSDRAVGAGGLCSPIVLRCSFPRPRRSSTSRRGVDVGFEGATLSSISLRALRAFSPPWPLPRSRGVPARLSPSASTPTGAASSIRCSNSTARSRRSPICRWSSSGSASANRPRSW